MPRPSLRDAAAAYVLRPLNGTHIGGQSAVRAGMALCVLGGALLALQLFLRRSHCACSGRLPKPKLPSQPFELGPGESARRVLPRGRFERVTSHADAFELEAQDGDAETAVDV